MFGITTDMLLMHLVILFKREKHHVNLINCEDYTIEKNKGSIIQDK